MVMAIEAICVPSDLTVIAVSAALILIAVFHRQPHCAL